MAKVVSFPSGRRVRPKPPLKPLGPAAQRRRDAADRSALETWGCILGLTSRESDLLADARDLACWAAERALAEGRIVNLMEIGRSLVAGAKTEDLQTFAAWLVGSFARQAVDLHRGKHEAG